MLIISYYAVYNYSYSAILFAFPAIPGLFAVSDAAIVGHILLGGVQAAELDDDIYI